MIFFYKNRKDLPLENYGYLPLVPMIKTLDSESVLEVLKPGLYAGADYASLSAA